MNDMRTPIYELFVGVFGPSQEIDYFALQILLAKIVPLILSKLPSLCALDILQITLLETHLLIRRDGEHTDSFVRSVGP